MEPSPSWQANSRSGSQEIYRILWNRKVHYQPLIPTWARWIQSTTCHPISLIPNTLRSSEWSLPFRFNYKNASCFSQLSHACYMPRRSHHPQFDHPNTIWWSIQVTKLLMVNFSPASRHFLLLWSKYLLQHPVLKQTRCMSFHQCASITLRNKLYGEEFLVPGTIPKL